MSKFSPWLKCKGEQRATAEIEHHGPDSSSSSSGPSYLCFCYFDLIVLNTHVNDGTGCKQQGHPAEAVLGIRNYDTGHGLCQLERRMLILLR